MEDQFPAPQIIPKRHIYYFFEFDSAIHLISKSYIYKETEERVPDFICTFITSSCAVSIDYMRLASTIKSLKKGRKPYTDKASKVRYNTDSKLLIVCFAGMWTLWRKYRGKHTEKIRFEITRGEYINGSAFINQSSMEG